MKRQKLGLAQAAALVLALDQASEHVAPREDVVLRSRRG
jgi:hypothetical protein